MAAVIRLESGTAGGRTARAGGTRHAAPTSRSPRCPGPFAPECALNADARRATLLEKLTVAIRAADPEGLSRDAAPAVAVVAEPDAEVLIVSVCDLSKPNARRTAGEKAPRRRRWVSAWTHRRRLPLPLGWRPAPPATAWAPRRSRRARVMPRPRSASAHEPPPAVPGPRSKQAEARWPAMSPSRSRWGMGRSLVSTRAPVTGSRAIVFAVSRCIADCSSSYDRRSS